MSEISPTFEERIRTGGFDVPPKFKWFYLSFINKTDGRFQGASMVTGEQAGMAIKAVFDLNLIPDGARTELITEIPADKLPAEEYRNRLLTREEVESIWPQVKEAQQ